MREVDLTAFATELANGAYVIDVRGSHEYRAGHVPGAHPAPLSALGAVVSALPRGLGRPRDLRERQPQPPGHRAPFEALGVDAVPVAGGTAAWARAGHSLDRGAVAAESA